MLINSANKEPSSEITTSSEFFNTDTLKTYIDNHFIWIDEALNYIDQIINDSNL